MMDVFILCLLGLILSYGGVFAFSFVFNLLLMVLLMKFGGLWEFFSIGYFGYMDLIGFMLVILSIWIIILMHFAMKNYMVWNKIFYITIEVVLLISLILSFYLYNLMGFYVFFEASLIPIMLIIFYWGGNPERAQAGMYMLIYTLFGSLPLLLILVYMSQVLTLNAFYLNFVSVDVSGVLGIFYLLAFLVKLPMYSLHLWLPKAHVEAPVAGSMMLAGVLLKLGGYGIFRVVIMMKNWLFVNGLNIAMFGLFGGMLIGFVCLRQVDIKILVAYSSVAHMSLVLGGMLSNTMWGMMGAMMLMVGHGLCSSGMFYTANIFYERLGSRNMFLMKGMGAFLSGAMILWFLLCIVNLGFPFSMNFVGEIVLGASIMKFNYYFIMPLMVLSFIGAAYSLYLFIQTYHGKSWVFNSFAPVNQRELMLGCYHLVPLFIFVFKGELFLWI